MQRVFLSEGAALLHIVMRQDTLKLADVVVARTHAMDTIYAIAPVEGP